MLKETKKKGLILNTRKWRNMNYLLAMIFGIVCVNMVIEVNICRIQNFLQPMAYRAALHVFGSAAL